jgi:hypothetical protein
LLTEEDISLLKKKGICQILGAANIATLHAFAKLFNRNCGPGRTLKIQNAQSMMQVLCKEISVYLPSDISDLEVQE